MKIIYKYFYFLIIFVFVLLINFKYEKILKNISVFYKINQYIKICQNGILINRIRKPTVKYKITVIVAIFNSEKTIRHSIRSIENQKMREIEIILVDDNSSDNSLKIIEELLKEDLRIKIIKNKKNRGSLYSKSIGVLNSKGEYLMNLDSDDSFASEKIFNLCFKEVKKNNIDILEFSGVCSIYKLKKYKIIKKVPLYLRFKKHNQIIKQPDLSNFIYVKKKNKIIRLIDSYLWGKCIKREVYIKSLNILGESIYNQNINYGEDRIINFIFFKVASSFKYINVIGIIYNIKNKSSITHQKNLIKKCHDELINLMTLYNLTKSTNNKKILIFEIKKRWKTIISRGLNENNKIYFKNLLAKIMINKYANLLKIKKYSL